MPEPKPREPGSSSNVKDEILAFARSIKRADAERQRLADQQKADDIKQHDERASALAGILAENDIPFTDLTERGYKGGEIDDFPKGWVLNDASPGDNAMGKDYASTSATMGHIITPDGEVVRFSYGNDSPFPESREPTVLKKHGTIHDLFVGDPGLKTLASIITRYKVPIHTPDEA